MNKFYLMRRVGEPKDRQGDRLVHFLDKANRKIQIDEVKHIKHSTIATSGEKDSLTIGFSSTNGKWNCCDSTRESSRVKI